MKSGGSLLAGVGVGAAFLYLFDPDRGARRRARVRDALAHTASLTSRAIGTTGRDALHRTYGTAASLRSLVQRDDVDDYVLVERVRERLGRLVSHPHAVEVAASNGVVTLRGPILTREASHLIRATGRVRGVREVVDELELHDQAGHLPSLQGGRAPAGDRMNVLQDHWAPATRAVVGTAGVALAVAGALRRDLPGTSAALVGVGLFARAATNVPMNRLMGLDADLVRMKTLIETGHAPHDAARRDAQHS